MKTIFDPAVRKELIGRVNNLNATSNRQWGKMNPDQAIHHINTAISANLGDFQPAGNPNPVKAAIMRAFTFSPIPIPKAKANTLPEFVSTGSYNMEAEKIRFRELIERFGSRANETRWPRSAIFGKVSAKQYGELAYKHTDHHLQQFGV